MEAKSIAQRMRYLSDDDFWRSMLTSDRRHIEAAPSWRSVIQSNAFRALTALPLGPLR